MKTEMRSTSKIKLLGMIITKRVFVDDQQVIQFFDFNYNGIPCIISTYGMNFSRKDEYRPHYAGFAETWNHCAYMLLTEQQLAIVDPDFIVDYYKSPDEKEESFRSFGYAGAVFQHDEVTYTEKRDDTYFQIGIDYQHGWHNADNVDLFTVMSRLMEEVDLLLEKHGAKFDEK